MLSLLLLWCWQAQAQPKSTHATLRKMGLTNHIVACVRDSSGVGLRTSLPHTRLATPTHLTACTCRGMKGDADMLPGYTLGKTLGLRLCLPACPCKHECECERACNVLAHRAVFLMHHAPP